MRSPRTPIAKTSIFLGVFALSSLLALAIAPLAQLINWAGLNLAEVITNPHLQRALRFTLWQSSLSTLISVGLAIPVARALSRRRFIGREWILKTSMLSFCLPVIVAAYAISLLFGEKGPINAFLALFSIDLPPIFGLPGIVLAHVFFNWPLATLLILRSLAQIPASHWRLAKQWSLRGFRLWRHIEWPNLRRALPPCIAMVFGLCFSSFAVILTLGGGPNTTTLEVAIYQSITSDFDLATAASLGLIQLLFCALIIGAGQGLSIGDGLQGRELALIERGDGKNIFSKTTDAIVLMLYVLFLLGPLLALIFRAIDAPMPSDFAPIWQALLTSWRVAISATAIAIFLSFALLIGSRELSVRRQKPKLAAATELPAMLIFMYPSLVLATGLFICFRPFYAQSWAAPTAVTLVNAVLVLPFALRLLKTPFFDIAQRHDRLCVAMNLSVLQRLRYIEWPLIKTDLAYAIAVCCALALGDMGAIALFGTSNFQTLPWLLHQMLGSYQFSQALWVALLLLSQCLLCYALIRLFAQPKARHA